MLFISLQLLFSLNRRHRQLSWKPPKLFCRWIFGKAVQHDSSVEAEKSLTDTQTDNELQSFKVRLPIAAAVINYKL